MKKLCRVKFVFFLQASALWSLSYYSSPLLLCYLYRKGTFGYKNCVLWEKKGGSNFFTATVLIRAGMIGSTFTMVDQLKINEPQY